MTVRTSSLSVKSARPRINPQKETNHLLAPAIAPSAAEVMGEHCAEAVSRRVPGTLAHRDELWSHVTRDLIARIGWG